MPFAPGNQAASKAGRPRKGTSLRELLRNHPIKDKRTLVAKAYELALGGDVRWAEWIAKHSGEGSDAPQVAEGGTVRRIVIEEVRYPSVSDAEPDDDDAIVLQLPHKSEMSA